MGSPKPTVRVSPLKPPSSSNLRRSRIASTFPRVRMGVRQLKLQTWQFVSVCRREWTLLITRAGEHFCIDPRANGRLQGRCRLLNHNSILVRRAHAYVHIYVWMNLKLICCICEFVHINSCNPTEWVCEAVCKSVCVCVGGINTNDILMLSVPAHHFPQSLCLLHPCNVFILFLFFCRLTLEL